MARIQQLKNKKGEVNFRKKLALQFEGKKCVFPGQPNYKEYKLIVKERIKGYKNIFNYLVKRNVVKSPFLEIGAGVGQASSLLENQYHVQGIASDISFETLTLTDSYQKYLKFKKLPIRICCDAYNLPFESASLPLVFCFETLHHFPDPKPVLTEIKRVLAPGGYFYFGGEPVSQIINLNLWRRDRHLTWFEKLLKAAILLHFISRIGKSEVEHNILEETFPLSLWEKALDIFNKVEVNLDVFPFGPNIKRIKKKLGWIKPPFFQRILLEILGGGIEGLCQIKIQKLERSKVTGNIFDVLICPNCSIKPKLKYNSKNQTLSCSNCKITYKPTKGVYLLLSQKEKLILYPDK